MPENMLVWFTHCFNKQDVLKIGLSFNMKAHVGAFNQATKLLCCWCIYFFPCVYSYMRRRAMPTSVVAGPPMLGLFIDNHVEFIVLFPQLDVRCMLFSLSYKCQLLKVSWQQHLQCNHHVRSVPVVTQIPTPNHITLTFLWNDCAAAPFFPARNDIKLQVDDTRCCWRCFCCVAPRVQLLKKTAWLLYPSGQEGFTCRAI